MYIYNGVRAHLSLNRWRSIGSEGRNSKVHIAHDPQLNEILVLKEITKESLEQQNIADFFLEAQILNEANHPHIMPVRYAAHDENNVYITMPYFMTGSVNTLMEQNHLTVREIIKYSLDFLSGLLFIHIKGMLHLDLKPTNIIINDNDRAILTDFGLARYLDDYGFALQEMQYSQHRSPESYDTDTKTVLDDVYQAGLTLYRMCNGNDLFKNQYKNLLESNNFNSDDIVQSIKKGEFPDRKFYLPHIPKKLRSIINKMLHPDPDKRCNNVLDVINSLSKIDENIDWEYTRDKNGNKHSWCLDNEKSTTNVILGISEGGHWKITAQKLTKTSGRTTNISKLTKVFGSELEAFKFLEENMNQ